MYLVAQNRTFQLLGLLQGSLIGKFELFPHRYLGSKCRVSVVGVSITMNRYEKVVRSVFRSGITITMWGSIPTRVPRTLWGTPDTLTSQYKIP